MNDLHQEFQNSRFFHEARIDRRSADALVGLAAGVTADGKVNHQEAQFLRSWIERHMIHLDDPVVNILYRRLNDMLSDGLLDAEESAELFALLRQFTGVQIGAAQPFQMATSLPLNEPAPTLEWSGRSFVFTGTMAFGPRKACEQVVIERGGSMAGSISKKVHFLVIGCLGNDQWLHSSYGTKIKKAVELRDAGSPIALISEDHWQRAAFG